MLAEIITIGDEILIGQIVDTNSAWIAPRLGEIGVRVHQITSVSDSAEHIKSAVEQALSRVDIVLITGGIGPTKDDITKSTLAQMFEMPLKRHDASYEHIRSMMESRGIEFNDLNQHQADLPLGCTALHNANGTAPGMWFDRSGKVVVSMPGVPFEMKALMSDQVIPLLKRRFQLQNVTHKTVITFGIAESSLALKLTDWENALPSQIHLAYLPSPAGVKLRLSIYEMDDKSEAASRDADQLISTQIESLKEILRENIVGYDNDTLESVVSELLRSRGETLSIAESCTGGALAAQFTALSGASQILKGGVVAYDNGVKVSVLGVSAADLAEYGAVSEQVACQMAEGVRKLTHSTYSLSTTGIAGPTGGTEQKPVGTVWIGLSTPSKTAANVRNGGQLRAQNIERSVAHAINLLRLELIKN